MFCSVMSEWWNGILWGLRTKTCSYRFWGSIAGSLATIEINSILSGLFFLFLFFFYTYALYTISFRGSFQLHHIIKLFIWKVMQLVPSFYFMVPFGRDCPEGIDCACNIQTEWIKFNHRHVTKLTSVMFVLLKEYVVILMWVIRVRTGNDFQE